MATITGTIFNDNNTTNGTPLIYRPSLIGTEFADIIRPLQKLGFPLDRIRVWDSFLERSIDGLSGNDYLYGGAGNDKLYGEFGNDTLNGGFADDIVDGESGNDTVYGYFGNDTLKGGDGNDTLDGGSENDTLNGGVGDDILYGGSAILTQRDTLTGGLGNDIFDFNSLNDSPIGSSLRDVITDFVGNGNLAGDRIDLSDIDANYNITGNQAFTFIGSAAFTALGQVRYSGGILRANITGDLAADFEISLTGSPSLVASDIIL